MATVTLEQDFINRLKKNGLNNETVKKREGLLNKFEGLPFPTRRDEEWKWIEARVVQLSNLELPYTTLNIKEEELNDPNYSAKIIVLHDQIQLLIDNKIKGKITVATNNSDKELKTIPVLSDKLTSLNDVFWTTGFILNIEKDTFLDKPILIQEQFEQTKILKNRINVGSFSKVQIFHKEQSSGSIFNDLVINIKDSATVDYYNVQSKLPETVDVSIESVVLGRDSTCNWYSLLDGSKLTKINQNCFFRGTGSTCNLYEGGILNTNEMLHIINSFAHMANNTTCKIYSKAVAKGTTTSSFRGNIIIEKNAINSDAMLNNKCLLLSDRSKIHSVPVLEILAKDVKCKHAASQGKVDPEQLFYLESRGIKNRHAVELITEGFINELFDKINNDNVKEMFINSIRNRANEA